MKNSPRDAVSPPDEAEEFALDLLDRVPGKASGLNVPKEGRSSHHRTFDGDDWELPEIGGFGDLD